MTPHYFVTEVCSGTPIPAEITPASQSDFAETKHNWQTDWTSGFIQRPELEKYALKISETGELVGLGAYQNLPESILVYVEYIESAPSSNPTISVEKRYSGIGAALLAYGVQLSIDYGYGGAIYLKAKTSEIRDHYIRDFGAIPFSHLNPFLLLIEGQAAQELFSYFLREE